MNSKTSGCFVAILLISSNILQVHSFALGAGDSWTFLFKNLGDWDRFDLGSRKGHFPSNNVGNNKLHSFINSLNLGGEDSLDSSSEEISDEESSVSSDNFGSNGASFRDPFDGESLNEQHGNTQASQSGTGQQGPSNGQGEQGGQKRTHTGVDHSTSSGTGNARGHQNNGNRISGSSQNGKHSATSDKNGGHSKNKGAESVSRNDVNSNSNNNANSGGLGNKGGSETWNTGNSLMDKNKQSGKSQKKSHAETWIDSILKTFNTVPSSPSLWRRFMSNSVEQEEIEAEDVTPRPTGSNVTTTEENEIENEGKGQPTTASPNKQTTTEEAEFEMEWEDTTTAKPASSTKPSPTRSIWQTPQQGSGSHTNSKWGKDSHQGFNAVTKENNQQGGFNKIPSNNVQQRQGFKPIPGAGGQQQGFRPVPGNNGPQRGSKPPSNSNGQQRGFRPIPRKNGQQQGFRPIPRNNGQQGGFRPIPRNNGQQNGFRPIPRNNAQQRGFRPIPNNNNGQQRGLRPVGGLQPKPSTKVLPGTNAGSSLPDINSGTWVEIKPEWKDKNAGHSSVGKQSGPGSQWNNIKPSASRGQNNVQRAGQRSQQQIRKEGRKGSWVDQNSSGWGVIDTRPDTVQRKKRPLVSGSRVVNRKHQQHEMVRGGGQVRNVGGTGGHWRQIKHSSKKGSSTSETLGGNVSSQRLHQNEIKKVTRTGATASGKPQDKLSKNLSNEKIVKPVHKAKNTVSSGYRGSGQKVGPTARPIYNGVVISLSPSSAANPPPTGQPKTKVKSDYDRMQELLNQHKSSIVVKEFIGSSTAVEKANTLSKSGNSKHRINNSKQSGAHSSQSVLTGSTSNVQKMSVDNTQDKPRNDVIAKMTSTGPLEGQKPIDIVPTQGSISKHIKADHILKKGTKSGPESKNIAELARTIQSKDKVSKTLNSGEVLTETVGPVVNPKAASTNRIIIVHDFGTMANLNTLSQKPKFGFIDKKHSKKNTTSPDPPKTKPKTRWMDTTFVKSAVEQPKRQAPLRKINPPVVENKPIISLGKSSNGLNSLRSSGNERVGGSGSSQMGSAQQSMTGQATKNVVSKKQGAWTKLPQITPARS